MYAAGVKEVWDVPKERNNTGRVIHTMGWPLGNEEFGGGFIYNMSEGRSPSASSSGWTIWIRVVDPHTNDFKSSRRILCSKSILEGGKLYAYGAKAFRKAAIGRSRSITSMAE